MSWLSGYLFRKKCTVVATIAGAQINYQMKLLVGESSGAAGEDTDCENHCQDFPNDFRFTAADGQTKHDYWVESLTGTTPNRLATVWIEVASVPASGSIDFYMYYGKAADSGEDSGANTFIFFTGNPTSLSFTETQALNVALKAWQGVTSDGTYLYTFTNCESGTNDVQKIYKLNKSGVQQDVNLAAGTAHMSGGCYHNSKLYVADMKNWYSGQPHSEAIGNIRLYNITSGLPYANENHDVGNHWAEAVCFYDSHFWIVFHCCSIIRKYDSDWNFIKEYDIDGHGGTETSWVDGNGYQGIAFFQDGSNIYAGLTVHHSVAGGPEFYYFEYDSVADSFTLIDHLDPPNTGANQGWGCDTPLDISDVWFADRQGPPGYIRQNAGSFGEKAAGNWDEFTDRTGGSLAITDTPQKRSSSKAFQYTQNSNSIHGLWRDKFGQQQTGKFWIEFDVRFPANDKKHLITTSEEMLTWTTAKKGTYIVMNRDVGHQGWISVYESAYNDIQIFTINQWYKFGELIDIAADTWDLWIDGAEKDTNLTFGYGNALSNIEQINVGGYLEYPAGSYYIQDVRIRKYASPEPVWGAWNNEESPFLFLKLLQEKGLNIDLSQKGADVNLKLSQEDKGLNLKLSQEGSPK